MDVEKKKEKDDSSLSSSTVPEEKNTVWVVAIVTIISLARIGHGLFISITGPTLLFLADNVNSEVTQVSAIFSGRSAGILVGSAVYSAVVNRFPKFRPFLSLGLGLIVSGLVMYVTPFLTSLAALVVVTTIGGLMFGYLDSGMQAVYLKLWGEEASRPYIQSFHFGFSVGAFLAPVLAKPFLEMASEESGDTQCPDTGETFTTSPFTTASYNTTKQDDNSDYFNPINWCFIIIGTFTTACALCMCVLALLNVEGRVTSHNVKTTEARKEESIKKLWILFLPVIFYYFCCVSTETVYAGYIYSIALCSDLKFSVANASTLNSLFWAGFGIGRGSAIIHAKFLKPTTIIIYDLIGTTTALVIMSIWGEQVALVAWIVTFFHGLCVATLYSSGVSWVSQSTNMAGTYMFVFTIGNAMGSMTMMPAGGALFDNDPFSVIYLICGLCAANIVFFVFMCIVARYRQRAVTVCEMEEVNSNGHCNEAYESEPSGKAEKLTPL